jgi:hypothetical protein
MAINYPKDPNDFRLRLEWSRYQLRNEVGQLVMAMMAQLIEEE